MEIQSRGPLGHHVRSHDAELFEGPGPARFDDDIGRVDETAEQRTMARIVEVEGDRSLRAVEKVEERTPDRDARRRAGWWTRP